MQTYNDIFIEELVRRERPGGELLFRVGVILLAIVLILAAFLFAYIVFPFLFTLVVILVFFAFRYTVLEYEYSFTNGELDVDKISGKRKRKRVMSFPCANVKRLAPCEKGVKPEGTFSATIDASRSKRQARWYAVVRAEDGSESLLYFSPSERLLEGMGKYLGNRLQSADGRPRVQRAKPESEAK